MRETIVRRCTMDKLEAIDFISRARGVTNDDKLAAIELVLKGVNAEKVVDVVTRIELELLVLDSLKH